MSCPLCGSQSVHLLQSIPVADVGAVYRRFLDIGTASCFAGDTLEYCRCAECDLSFFTPPSPGDEAFYNALQKYDWYYADEKDEFRAAAGWVRPDDRVLEIGCGKGAFARHIECASYEGIDLSENAVRMAGEAGVRATCTTIEAHAGDRRGACDAVCAFQTLEHVVSPGEFLDAAVSCLAPGGRLMVSVPSQSSFVGRTCNGVLNLPPHHLTRWTDDALRAIGRLHGLELKTLDHLPLDAAHFEWYAMTRILWPLRRLPGLDSRAAVDNSRLYWMLYALARFLARRGVARPDQSALPDGHTVLAVYEKVPE